MKMKKIVLIGDGMADWPIDTLDGKTPMEVAYTPNMDRLAQKGIQLLCKTVPDGILPGSDVAILSIMGYDPQTHYTGRAPMEAASMGVPVPEDYTVFRCNTVTTKDGFMEDYSAGHITTPESQTIIQDLDKELTAPNYKFFPGVSYRHLLVIQGDYRDLKCTPPHDILNKEIANYLPTGPGQNIIRELMDKSIAICGSHPVNDKRIADGHSPATQIWLWGQGKMPQLESFCEKYDINGGTIISAVDLVKGIGILAKLDVPQVEGLTGYLDTNYANKVKSGLEGLKKNEFLLIHVEAPDECGHQGRPDLKVKAIEDFDCHIVGPILDWAEENGDCDIMVLPDHPTPCAFRTHVSEPVPVLIGSINASQTEKKVSTYCEKTAKESNLFIDHGHDLMGFFMKSSWKTEIR